MEKLISRLKEHTVALSAVVLVAIIVIFTLLYLNNSLKNNLSNRDEDISKLEKQIIENQTMIATLNAEKEKMIGQIAQNAVEYDAEIADLKSKISEFENQKANAYQYPQYYTDYLIQNGFSTPALLMETLTNKDSIIPIKGVLGGTMHWVPENSILLTDKFVFASFEDGHVAGFALLQYSFEGQGEVNWKVIETYVD
ncbi:hypothetical protein [Fusibacter bizertensis]